MTAKWENHAGDFRGEMTMSSAHHDHLVFNGVNGVTGEYMLPPLTARDISAAARGEPPPEDSHLRELRWWHEYSSQAQMGPIEGVDPKQLAETGWGVIFARDVDPRVRDALKPLLRLRQSQATRRDERFYRELVFRPHESKLKFLARYGAGPGPADPRKVPYYLLIVGSPVVIPFRFQYQLDVQYAVGRLDFETPEEFARYAESVVEVETRGVELPRRMTFFGVKNPDDQATRLSHDHLIKPLAKRMAKELDGWQVKKLMGRKATKARLLKRLGGKKTPSLLFTASHGVGFPNGHKLQQPHQGALLCQDWSGPRAGGVSQDVYLAGDDVTDDARPLGLVAFHFACYGAGTPMLDYFAQRTFQKPRPIAAHDFVARLPRRLLGHPRGGALAVVAHIERTWTYAFLWPKAGEQLQVYEGLIKRLVDGHPVGSAMEFFDQRYAELSSDLADELEEIDHGRAPDDATLAGLWTANNDARSFIILGDPAVRLTATGRRR